MSSSCVGIRFTIDFRNGDVNVTGQTITAQFNTSRPAISILCTLDGEPQDCMSVISPYFFSLFSYPFCVYHQILHLQQLCFQFPYSLNSFPNLLFLFNSSGPYLTWLHLPHFPNYFGPGWKIILCFCLLPTIFVLMETWKCVITAQIFQELCS